MNAQCQLLKSFRLTLLIYSIAGVNLGCLPLNKDRKDESEVKVKLPGLNWETYVPPVSKFDPSTFLHSSTFKPTKNPKEFDVGIDSVKKVDPYKFVNDIGANRLVAVAKKLSKIKEGNKQLIRITKARAVINEFYGVRYKLERQDGDVGLIPKAPKMVEIELPKRGELDAIFEDIRGGNLEIEINTSVDDLKNNVKNYISSFVIPSKHKMRFDDYHKIKEDKVYTQDELAELDAEFIKKHGVSRDAIYRTAISFGILEKNKVDFDFEELFKACARN